VKLHGWRHLDPAVLVDLRKMAVIRENPYALLHAQYVSSQNQVSALEGYQAVLIPPITAADQFDSNIRSAVYVAHLTIALSSPKKLTARKEIARGAQGLANTLQALRRDEKEILIHFLSHRRQAAFDDFVTATRELADEARNICRLAGRPQGWLRRQAQRSFVNLLLDAAADAGGRLRLNARTEGGTLVDAIELLLPNLPQEISKMPSFSTLKRWREAWVQKRRK
jgi:hypothetical protein